MRQKLGQQGLLVQQLGLVPKQPVLGQPEQLLQGLRPGEQPREPPQQLERQRVQQLLAQAQALRGQELPRQHLHQ
jgi:hypothetical protein